MNHHNKKAICLVIAVIAVCIIAVTVMIFIFARTSSAAQLRMYTTTEDGAYTFPKPQKFEPIGADADKFDIYCVGVMSSYNSFDNWVLLSVRSLDGKYYTIGDEDGYGYVERYGRDGWETVTEDIWSEEYFVSTDEYGGINSLILPDGEKDLNHTTAKLVGLPLLEPGHYRVMFHASGFVSDFEKRKPRQETYGGLEFGFEYEIPERRFPEDGEMELLSLYMTSPEYTSSVRIDPIFITGGTVRYIRPESIKLERLDPTSGQYLPLEGSIGFLSESSDPLTRYINMLTYHGDDSLSAVLVPVTGVQILDWGSFNLDDEYRLSMSFTENEDGSGAEYTANLRLRFKD